jgi:hypothetical protein
MARGQHTLDGKPGSLHEIRTYTGGITFVMAPPGTPRGGKLVIRCDENGDVWISIGSETGADESES